MLFHDEELAHPSKVYKISVDLLFQLVQLLPQQSHRILDDHRHRHRPHRLHREDVPILLFTFILIRLPIFR